MNATTLTAAAKRHAARAFGTSAPAVSSDTGHMAGRRPRQRLIGVASLAALASIAGGYTASAWFRTQVAESFTHRPTPYTALFFTDHTSLPRNLGMVGPIPFSFTIANHEGHLVDYHYMVVGVGAVGGAQSPAVAEASAAVGNGASVVNTVEFVPPRPNTTYTITIQLVDRPEFIHFTARS
jgi:hypothetical protein